MLLTQRHGEDLYRPPLSSPFLSAVGDNELNKIESSWKCSMSTSIPGEVNHFSTASKNIKLSRLTFGLWNVNGSGDWISERGCFSLGYQRRTKRRMRRMNGGVVFFSSCSGCHPRCRRNADPCCCWTVSWCNTGQEKGCSLATSITTSLARI